MKLLYITYIDTKQKPTSGSSVRALKMLEAFKELGCEIMLLEGWNSKDGLEERKRNVHAMRERLKEERPDACYVEVPSGPLFCREDVLILKETREKGVPLSIFYGDAFWKFPEFAGSEVVGGLKNRAKQKVVAWMQRYDWSLYRKVATRIYFPSSTMAEHFDFASKGVSFPGTFNAPQSLLDKKNDIPMAVYVGGATYRYGAHLLLDAFDRVNSEGIRVRLTFICQDSAWRQLPREYRAFEEKEWLLRLSASGDEALAPLYAGADFACLPLRRNIYNDFAMPIKLFEYISYRKPIIATDCIEQAAFIRENGIGLVAPDTTEGYARAILEFLALGETEKETLKRNMDATGERNTWRHRAQAVLDDFKSG
jgi:glycosyltransferase involved in cell wall biosynthesis